MNGFDNNRVLSQHYPLPIFHVLTYIDSNIHQKLLLADLAGMISYSPFHFHRMFKSSLGITLNEYITSYRMQKVIQYLKFHPHLSLTDIAERCGFPALNELSRKFKAQYGQTATQFRENYHQNSKICIMDRKISERYFNVNYYNEIQGDGRPVIKENRILKVTIKMIPQYQAVFLPLLGDGSVHRMQNELKQAFQSLASLKSSFHSYSFQSLLIGKVHYESSSEKGLLSWRYDACMTIPSNKVEDGLPATAITGGLYAVLRLHNDPDHRESLLDAFYQEWLPASGYSLSDEPCLEIFGSAQAFQAGFPPYVDYCVPLLDS